MDTLTLVTETVERNDYGVEVKTEKHDEVLCKTDSVTSQEFYEGGRNGLNPEYRFVVFHGDYSGQRTVIYKGLYYGIYRTYKNGDDIELYAERKGGTNG